LDSPANIDISPAISDAPDDSVTSPEEPFDCPVDKLIFPESESTPVPVATFILPDEEESEEIKVISPLEDEVLIPEDIKIEPPAPKLLAPAKILIDAPTPCVVDSPSPTTKSPAVSAAELPVSNLIVPEIKGASPVPRRTDPLKPSFEEVLPVEIAKDPLAAPSPVAMPSSPEPCLENPDDIVTLPELLFSEDPVFSATDPVEYE